MPVVDFYCCTFHQSPSVPVIRRDRQKWRCLARSWRTVRLGEGLRNYSYLTDLFLRGNALRARMQKQTGMQCRVTCSYSFSGHSILLTLAWPYPTHQSFFLGKVWLRENSWLFWLTTRMFFAALCCVSFPPPQLVNNFRITSSGPSDKVW